MRRFAWFLVLPALAFASEPPRTLHADDFSRDLRPWSVEQMPGGSVRAARGILTIEDAAGCTVWFREKLTAPVEITYEITAVSRGGPHDRVSDVNCFWMATDPKAPQARPVGRTGKFDQYDSLCTYYVGMGGNGNTTTRFRRYAGDGTKPLLPEHDLSAPRFLLEPNKPYRIRIVVHADGATEYWRNGEKFFSFHDPAPLRSGWFAFRTVQSHLEIRDFRVTNR